VCRTSPVRPARTSTLRFAGGRPPIRNLPASRGTEPIRTTSRSPTPLAVTRYVVSELARSQVTVVPNGDGGDEVFGVYDRFVAAAMSWSMPAPVANLGPISTGGVM
jgi:Asparagine synthase